MTFVNETKPVDRSKEKAMFGRNYYGYDKASALLFMWSRLLQRIVSQGLTYLFTGKFHHSDCAIYKTEGGCNIVGVGELVLSDDMCYFDAFGSKDLNGKAETASELITKIVLAWDPNNPIDSMVAPAAEFIKINTEEFKKVVTDSIAGGVFGGNSLADFFKWNPFSKAPINREYQRWCLINYDDMTEAEVDQMYADEDLGEDLLKKINEKIRKTDPDGYRSALCCSPRRFENKKLHFWINTGRSTQIDGWKTEEDIQKFLDSDGILVDTMKF